MRMLVTGGAGFIGSNLVDALLDDGHAVAVLDNFATGRHSNLADALERGADLHEVDLQDTAAVAETVAATRPDVVFHLAAQIDVRKSVADPVFDAQVNVAGTYGLLEACRVAGVPRFVFASTAGALYGDAKVIPTPEHAPIAPMSPYGQNKHAAEGACTLYARLHSLSTAVLRFANVYGPRQDPLGEAGVVAIYCGCALTNQSPTAFGDGRQTRDYVYVGDVVDALVRAGESSVVGAFNVGTGVETSVLDVAAALRTSEPGWTAAVEHAPRRAGELERSCPDVGAINAELGWSAQVGLEDGLARTLAAARQEITA